MRGERRPVTLFHSIGVFPVWKAKSFGQVRLEIQDLETAVQLLGGLSNDVPHHAMHIFWGWPLPRMQSWQMKVLVGIPEPKKYDTLRWWLESCEGGRTQHIFSHAPIPSASGFGVGFGCLNTSREVFIWTTRDYTLFLACRIWTRNHLMVTQE